MENTRRAVKDLGTQVETLRERRPGNKKNDEDHRGETGAETPGSCWAVRMNSGLFSVPWAQTKKVLEEGGVDIVVVRPEGEDDDENENDMEAKTGEKERRQTILELGKMWPTRGRLLPRKEAPSGQHLFMRVWKSGERRGVGGMA